MDDKRIQQLIAELDSAVPRDGAAVRWTKNGAGGRECAMIASKLGYLRLGIEFLKAGFIPTDKELPERQSVNVDVDYLITKDSDYAFDIFHRKDDLRLEECTRSPASSKSVLGFIAVMAFVIFALVGLITTVRFVLHF